MATQTEPKRETGREDVFHIDVRDDGIAVVTIDVPGESQNTLKAQFADQAEALFDELDENRAVKAVIFISGKPGSFIAGADINMLYTCESAAEATELSRSGQDVLDRIENSRVPVIAAIDGSCLGGGLELAMACHGRIATDSPKTALGLPEVMIGVLPGTGGTQRLPRLVGIPAAIDLMLTGRHVRPGRARKMGLVDEVVAGPILQDAAVKMAKKLQRKGHRQERKKGLVKWALEGNPIGRKVLFDQARKRMLAQTKGHYPAPKRILDAVEIGARDGFKAGLKAEAEYFGELAVTPEARQLMRLYFATTAMKKDKGVADESVKPREVHRVAVLGAGLMGAGIGYVTLAKAGIPVRLKDKNAQGLSRGVKHIRAQIDSRLEKKALSAIEANKQKHRLSTTLDYSGFKSVDMVIEAVFEDLDLKHSMVKDVEEHGGPDTIFASNTSSIPIARIAEAAQRPENVIGMHYFSPVEKMPLLEVIATDRTRPEVIATTVETGRRQGKTPIVVKDGAGFYVNRILAPYMNEANHMLAEGVPIDRIDKALTDFGFPVGPFALLDEVGIDVGSKVLPILHEAFGDRMKPAAPADTMLEDGRYGKKSKKGFYKYDDTRKKGRKEVDESVYQLLGITPDRDLPADEIVDRAVLTMVNEAARCYEEGVIRSLRDGDVGAIFGIGFPPFRGGPFRYADTRGIKAVVERLRQFERDHGERFAPAEVLVKLADEGHGFYHNEESRAA